jgi:hypothetical protein
MIELHHLGSCMELMMHLPAIVTIVIALPLDQILEVIINLYLIVRATFTVLRSNLYSR